MRWARAFFVSVYVCMHVCERVYLYSKEIRNSGKHINQNVGTLSRSIVVRRSSNVWGKAIVKIVVNERQQFLIFVQFVLLMAGLTRDNKLYLAVGSHNVYNKT